MSVFVTLVTQHAMRMRHIVNCGLRRLYSICQHYLIKARLSENVFEHKMCVLIFSTTFFSETFLILRRNE